MPWSASHSVKPFAAEPIEGVAGELLLSARRWTLLEVADGVEHPVSILLPGLDGTGEMFGPFISAAPPSLPVRVQRLPSERPCGYDELADELCRSLPSEPLALIAESFSGPLAIKLANCCPQVFAVVLCASFVRAPLPKELGRFPEGLWRRPPPSLALRLLLTGGDHGLAEAVRAAVAQVDSAVLHARVRAALAVDASAELKGLRQPLLVVRAQRDRLVRARCAAEISAERPSAEVATVDGPHLILQARPEESWRVIAPFLERASRRIAG